MPPHGAPVPCHGPGCNRHPAAPVAPAVPFSVPADQWGCISRPETVGAGAPAFALRDPGGPRPVRRASSVYHPPRLTRAASVV
jgi:hypothetical protein